MTSAPKSAIDVGRQTPPPGGEHRGSLRDWIRLLRPTQWIKNLFVLPALLFSGRALQTGAVLQSVGAFGTFCLLASGVYLCNDARDWRADRSHPTKRHRPIAAGRIPARTAATVGLVLIAIGLAGAAALDRDLLLIGALYATLNGAYTLWLKRIVILDVFALASFFVFRLLAGAVVIDVRPSIWLLLCGGLLALYLGFAKRRHELLLLGEGSAEHRPVLDHYSSAFLDQMSVVLLSVTIVAYIMYTLTSETAIAIGSDALAYSAVFVLYGVFRYLYLVHQRERGSPTETLLTDPSLLVSVGLWLVYCGWVLYRPR